MLRCACAAVLLCAALAYTQDYKRAEMSASPFVLSTRYGRSQPRMLSPRADRFFLNGRYGKRSDPAIFDINERERDRDRGREGQSERDMFYKGRPRCDCARYVKGIALKNYYKRTPEVMDQTVYQD